MHRVFSFLTFTLMLTAAGSVSAHGFRIDIDNNNKLQLYTDDLTAGGRLLYKTSTLLGPAAFRSADHPGYDVDTQHGSSGFSGGESIHFDVLGPLWYSSGNSAIPSPAGVEMVITPQDNTVPGSVTASGSSGFQPGFLIGDFDGSAIGAFEHQLNYEIDVPAGVPTGAYALAMRLTGTNSAQQPFTPSDPFVAVWNNGIPIGNFPAVANVLYSAATAVPEPSSILVAAIAALGVLLFGRRRKRA